MPLDPSISLQARPPEPVLPSNPLAAAGQLQGLQQGQLGIQAGQLGVQSKALELQSQTTQLQQLQQSFAARQRLGQIMATAPDTEQGLAKAAQDPEIAKYPNLLTDYRALQATMATIGLQQQETRTSKAHEVEGWTAAARNQADTGLLGAQTSKVQQEISGGLYAQAVKIIAGSTPETLGRNYARWLSTLPPDQAKLISPLANDIVTSMGAGAQAGKDPKAAGQAYADTAARLLFSTGGDPTALLGKPTIQMGPGSLPTRMQEAPVLPPPGGAPGGPSPVPTPQPNQAGGQAEAPGATSPASAAPVGPLAGTGQPLLAPLVGLASPPPHDPNLNDKMAASLIEAHAGPQREVFRQGQVALSQLDDIEAALEKMASTGGVLAPGAGAALRVSLAKGINLLSGIAGGKPVYDPTAIAAAEEATKEAIRLGFSSGKALLGGQREAMQTIDEAIDAVPGIQNTILGGKLIVAAMRAQIQRTQDQWKFEDEWRKRTGGDLTGADEKFAAAFPAEQYQKQVLGQFGLGPKGFTTPEAVRDAYQRGDLTRDQAKDLLKTVKPGGK